MSDDLLPRIRQDDARERAAENGVGAWTTVYSSWSDNADRGGQFSAFAPVEYREQALGRGGWDLSKGDGAPGFMQSYSEDDVETTYLRYGNTAGIEPLVLLQSHHEIMPRMLPQISEEFRLFHNLWVSVDGSQLVKIEEDGSESVAATVSATEVRIRTPLLRQFQAARQLDLLLFIDSVRYLPEAAPETDFESLSEEIQGEDHRYFFDAVGDGFPSGPFSRFNGKKLLTPPPVDKSGVWPYENDEESYVEFVIGEDEFGVPIRNTCDPDQLADYFGGNPDAPHYLTPVFFHREVLKRYYEEPARYSVEDGYLRCAGLWGVRIDNDHPDHVMVFLGDLGRDLPASHRDYWRSFNLAPTGSMSRTVFRRSFLAEWADPEAPDLIFKRLYKRFNDDWEKSKGWRLFRVPHKDDEHVIQRLRVPLNETQPEFEEQISGLTKILIDSLNEKQLAKELGGALKDEKGIDKLQRWLASANYPHFARDISFLRRLQRLRSRGTAHRKAADFEAFMKREGVDESKQVEVVRQLWAANQMLTDLAAHFAIQL